MYQFLSKFGFDSKNDININIKIRMTAFIKAKLNQT